MEDELREDGFEGPRRGPNPHRGGVGTATRRRAGARFHPGATRGSVVDPRRGGGGRRDGVKEGEQLRARKATFPCEGTEIVVTMEDEASGTRIAFVSAGFGPDFEERRPWLESGWWAIRPTCSSTSIAACRPGRRLRPWSSVGGRWRRRRAGSRSVDGRGAGRRPGRGPVGLKGDLFGGLG